MKMMEPLRKDDVASMNEGGDLTDGVINHFFWLLQRRSGQSKITKSVQIFPTQFFDRWFRNGDGYDGIRRWVKENPLTKDFVLFPFHVPRGKGHWALIIARPQKRNITSFDSLGGAHNDKMEALNEFFQRESQTRNQGWKNNWPTVNMLNRTPQQSNTHDCGVFVCLTADLLVREQSLNALRNTTPREMRESLKRKITWMSSEDFQEKHVADKTKNGHPKSNLKKTSAGVLSRPPLSRRRNSPTGKSSLLLERWKNPGNSSSPQVISNREGYSQIVDGKIYHLPAEDFLEVILSEYQPPPPIIDPLLDEIDKFVEDQQPDLFPRPPSQSSPVAEALSKMLLASPNHLDTEDVLPEPPRPTVPDPEKKRSTLPAPQDQSKNLRRTRGRTVRKRLEINGRLVRMNKRKLQAYLPTSDVSK